MRTELINKRFQLERLISGVKRYHSGHLTDKQLEGDPKYGTYQDLIDALENLNKYDFTCEAVENILGMYYCSEILCEVCEKEVKEVVTVTGGLDGSGPDISMCKSCTEKVLSTFPT